MSGPATYEIRVQDVLDEKWKDHFNPFRLTLRENETLISGFARDQAELFGVLLKIRDAGLTLLSINLAFNPNDP
jgi:phosphopantothenoylcysteine synthetase/decarboxylase